MTRKRTLALLALAALTAGCQQPVTEIAETAAAPSPPPAGAPTTQAATAAADLLPNMKRPLDGVISGGQPSAEQLAAVRDAGYKTVINLRLPEERGVGNEPQLVSDLGMEYVSIPVRGSAGLTRENVEAFAQALEISEYPVMIHCGSGNRIGAMFALKAFWLDGKSVDEAIEIGIDAGMTRLEGAVKELLEAEAGV